MTDKTPQKIYHMEFSEMINKNYRIMQVTDNREETRYYVQKKFLGIFWVNFGGYCPGIMDYYCDFDSAKKELFSLCRNSKIKYFYTDVDPITNSCKIIEDKLE